MRRMKALESELIPFCLRNVNPRSSLSRKLETTVERSFADKFDNGTPPMKTVKGLVLRVRF